MRVPIPNMLFQIETSSILKTGVLPLEYVTYQVPGRKDKGEFYLTKGLYPRLRLLDATKGTVDLVRLPTPQPAYEEPRHGAR